MNNIIILIAILLTGCSVTPQYEAPYRQPWVVYKTRADIVHIHTNDI